MPQLYVYPQMRWDYTGLIAATDPFGGSYDVLPAVWAAAPGSYLQPSIQRLEASSDEGQAAAIAAKAVLAGGFGDALRPSGLTVVVSNRSSHCSQSCGRGGRACFCKVEVLKLLNGRLANWRDAHSRLVVEWAYSKTYTGPQNLPQVSATNCPLITCKDFYSHGCK